MTESHQERLQKIKAIYPNAYEPWSAAEDELEAISKMVNFGSNPIWRRADGPY